MNISDSNKSLFNYFEVDDKRSKYYSIWAYQIQFLFLKCQYLQ